MTKFVDILSYHNTLTNYTLIDGLTPDIVKRKYIWLLNAIVENAIVGQDDYGLVWYAGEWFAGEWEDGTWYSGTWHDGEWKNGNFYSYRFDNRQLLQRNKRILEKDNPNYSQFLGGIWRRGNFYSGFFGPVHDFEGWENKSYIEILYHSIRWESGTFYGGYFRNAAWIKGLFKSGIFYNSEWINGTFLNGTFQGNRWWNGNFTGGDFILGEWIYGNFNQTNSSIKSRFGSMPITDEDSTETSVYWRDGNFMNGEFHSGLNIVSGVTQISDNHNRTIWYDGKWVNGSWYGGTHIDGDFNNGSWYEGFWYGGTFNNGIWYNGFWFDGVINNGFFIQGLFKNVEFKGGQLGYQPSDYILLKENIQKSNLTSKPNTLALAPTITTFEVVNVTSTSASSGGNITSDGGGDVIQRGVCWSIDINPTINNDHTNDGYGIGSFTSFITGLSSGVGYYIRAYAINSVSIAYGNQILFLTE